VAETNYLSKGTGINGSTLKIFDAGLPFSFRLAELLAFSSKEFYPKPEYNFPPLAWQHF
jgi:hypothetical protein